MENIKGIQIKYLEMKTTIHKVKNTLDGINNRLNITERKASELENIAIETI